jgi:four helix bundle protein
MTYEQWETDVAECIRKDSLWRVKAYRLALFLSDLAWNDVTKLVRDKRTFEIADQLYRATGNISSSIAEGYSRGTGKDRARFYEYSLGSCRESRDWYYKSRWVLDATVVNHRMELASGIIRLLLTMIATEGRSNRKIRPDGR